MKTLFNYIYLMVLATLAVVMVACSSDETAGQGEEVQMTDDGKVAVRLHLSVAGQSGQASTRTRWQDGNATDDEMMNVWTVVAVHAEDDTNDPKAFLAGDIAFIHASVPTAAKREIDDLVYLQPGRYMFYSFANMEPGYVTMDILGIGDTKDSFTLIDSDGNLGTSIPYSSDFFYDSTHNDVYLLTWAPECKINLHEYYGNYDLGVAGKTVYVDGNGFDPTASNNGFYSKGIPMSNVQEIEVTGSDDVNLIVVRMMAKMELKITNSTGRSLTVNNVTLTDITENDQDNLKLLPNLSTAGANTMDAIHGDIQPNLASEALADDYTHIVNKTIASGATETVTFYVNESATPKNEFGHFFLKIEIDDEGEQRYALIDDANAPGKTGSWNYIARNDYRVIPIVLDDYKLDIIPYDFPAIGVYPASVKEEDGLYTISFHDYGHFHLQPVMKQLSNNSVVPFTATTPDYSSTTWGLIDNDFTKSWTSWTGVDKATAYDNSTASPAFYRTGTETYVTTTTDGDEVGGTPVWYANTASPQWDPADGTTYRPFIFGYIADPGQALTEDRKVYHEFSVNLYRQGMSTPRVMTYRLLMKLDKNQMNYARALHQCGNCRSCGSHVGR